MESSEIRPVFCTALQDYLRYLYVKYDWNPCNIEGARAGTKIQAHILDWSAAASNVSKTYRYIMDFILSNIST